MRGIVVVGPNPEGRHWALLLATAGLHSVTIEAKPKEPEPIILEMQKLPEFEYRPPAKPSKFIPSKESQPWKRRK